MIFELKNTHDSPTEILGGKSTSTALMNELGIPCPPSAALPVSLFFDYVNGRDPRKKILETLRPFLNRFSKNQKFILRSSAVGEDSASHSFAGQFDSLVSTADDAALSANLGRVWDSCFSIRSQAYQLKKNVIVPGMGVLIQPFFEPAFSGILFTRDPRTPVGGAMLLEYHAGAGEDIVQGRIIPQRLRIKGTAGGQIFLGPGAETLKKNQKLFSSVKELVNHARKIERNAGCPQDIEWLSTAAGKLFLVQTRPITVPAAAREKHLWSNTNVNENFPEPVIPFIQSFAVRGYEYYFRNLGKAFGFPLHALHRLEGSFRGIIGFHRHFMYYNLSHIYRTFHYFPFPKALRSYWDIFIGVYGKNAAKAAATEPRLSVRERLTILLRMTFAFLFLPLRVRKFENRAHQQILGSPRDGSRLELHQNWIRGFLNLRFHHWLDASLADAAAMFSYGLLRQFLKNHGQAKNLNALLAGIPRLISHEPQVDLWNLAEAIQAKPMLLNQFLKSPHSKIWNALRLPENKEVMKQFENYQKVWGHRVSGELLMTRPDFQEDPFPLLDLVRGYLVHLSPSPQSILRERTRGAGQTAREIGRQLFFRHGVWAGFWKILFFRFYIFAAHTGMRYRERVRNQQARLYNSCRRRLLAIGKLLQKHKVLGRPDEALFLEASEILSPILFHQKKIIGEVVAKRESDWKKAFSQKPPDQFLLAAGKSLDLIAQDFLKPTSEVKTRKLQFAQTLRGECACPGKIIGRARILHHVSEMKKLKPGEILVTRQTDPGWAPIFPLIKGLVIERGGMLSHGAIIAREYGIPALVAVNAATRKIPKGRVIVLDAAKGKVSW